MDSAVCVLLLLGVISEGQGISIIFIFTVVFLTATYLIN